MPGHGIATLEPRAFYCCGGLMTCTGSIHFARLDKSPRLQRIFSALTDAGDRGLTTMEIISRADVCAVNSAICELRLNNKRVECTPEGRTAGGSNVFRYRLLPDDMSPSISNKSFAPSEGQFFLPISQPQISNNPLSAQTPLTIKGGAITISNSQHKAIN